LPEHPKVPPRFGELVSELLRLTQEQRISWSTTDDPETLLLLRDSGHVLLSRTRGRALYRVALHTPSGEEVQSYTSPGGSADPNEARLAYFIRQLWEAAVVSARANDTLVSKFLEDLRKG
jgi:hypothetical protein